MLVINQHKCWNTAKPPSNTDTPTRCLSWPCGVTALRQQCPMVEDTMLRTGTAHIHIHSCLILEAKACHLDERPLGHLKHERQKLRNHKHLSNNELKTLTELAYLILPSCLCRMSKRRKDYHRATKWQLHSISAADMLGKKRLTSSQISSSLHAQL